MTDQEWFDMFKQSLKIPEESLKQIIKHLNKQNLWPDDVDFVDFFEFYQWLHVTRRTEGFEASFALKLISEWHREIRGNYRRLGDYMDLFEAEPKVVGLLIHARTGLINARTTLGRGYIHFKDGPSADAIDELINSLESSL